MSAATSRTRAFCPTCDGLGLVTYPPLNAVTLCSTCDGCGLVNRAPVPCLACGDTGVESTLGGEILCTACHPPRPGEVREVHDPATPHDWLAVTAFLALSALVSGGLVWAAYAWVHR